MSNNYLIEYNKWLNNKSLDTKSKDLLLNMSEPEKEDSFYKNISFGTAGMRGIIGVGTNRFNIYTLRKANYGYGKYLTSLNKKDITVVIARDNRLMGQEFVEECVKILSKFNIKCYVFNEITPTPVLSYAIRYLKADGGIVITASHNPKEYNGYKIYDNTGCQLTPKFADIVIKNVNESPDYFDIEINDYDYCIQNNYVLNINNELIDSYIEEVKTISINRELNKNNFSLTISPLHGTGGKISCRLLGELGFKYIKVEEQFNNDSSFPTVKYPNPEDKEALSLSIEYAKKYNCDICLATDPDSDRIGIAVKNNNNEYILLNGNQIGTIILDYLCKNKDVSNTYMIDTIVSSKLNREIAKKHNINVITTYTGFKFIGEQISYLSNNNKKFLFAYEESYGYLLKDITRDKDAFQPLVLLTEIACYYKNHNKNLLDVLEEIYSEYGYYKEEVISIPFEGINGTKQINNLINHLQNDYIHSVGDTRVDEKINYCSNDLILNDINLGKSNIIVLKFRWGNYAIFRPSGTEPKFKVYLGVFCPDKEHIDTIYDLIYLDILNYIISYNKIKWLKWDSVSPILCILYYIFFSNSFASLFPKLAALINHCLPIDLSQIQYAFPVIII